MLSSWGQEFLAFSDKASVISPAALFYGTLGEGVSEAGKEGKEAGTDLSSLQTPKSFCVSHTFVDEELGTLASGSQAGFRKPLGNEGKWDVDEPFAAVSIGKSRRAFLCTASPGSLAESFACNCLRTERVAAGT